MPTRLFSPTHVANIIVLLLAAILPLANFALENSAELAPADYAVIGLIAAGVTLLGFLISVVVTRVLNGDPWSSTLATATAIVLFFTYGDAISAIYAVLFALFEASRGPIWVFAVLASAFIAAVYRLSTNVGIRRFFITTIVIAATLATAQLALRLSQQGGEVISH